MSIVKQDYDAFRKIWDQIPPLTKSDEVRNKVGLGDGADAECFVQSVIYLEALIQIAGTVLLSSLPPQEIKAVDDAIRPVNWKQCKEKAVSIRHRLKPGSGGMSQGLVNEVLKSIHELFLLIVPFVNVRPEVVQGLEKALKSHQKDVVEHKNNLEKEFGQLRENFEKYEEGHKEYIESKKEEIDGLISDLTTAGLGEAFSARRKTYRVPTVLFTGLFMLTMAGILVISFWSPGHGWGVKPPADTHALVYGILARTPLVFPLAWLAFFAAKRRNEYMRLEEEYAHKETLAKSFMAFRNQAEKTGEEDARALSLKLLEATIGTLESNASQVLDKNHDDGMPVQIRSRRSKG